MTYEELLAQKLLAYLCVEGAGSHKTCTLNTSMGETISFDGETCVAIYSYERELLYVYTPEVRVLYVSQASYEMILAEVRELQKQIISLIAHSKDPLED